MKKAWKPYGVEVQLKANRIKSIIEQGTKSREVVKKIDS